MFYDAKWWKKLLKYKAFSSQNVTRSLYFERFTVVMSGLDMFQDDRCL
jgi:hypothetical protein